jgi:pyruvate carboxylase
MPGMVASLAVSIGHQVKEGDALLTLEAMKMFTTVTAPFAATISEISVAVGHTVESKDLLMRLKKL